jgi:cysteine desulfurase family protein (TIGR01976 family)
MRDRFPGLATDWARFDGPAGTQMVDTAIEAMAEHLRSGAQANTHGRFAASEATTAMVARTRAQVATLLGADADGIVFGPNMTTMNLALTRALAREWASGDEIVGTRLDHDANVTPWQLAADERGATLRLAPFDPRTGRLDPAAVVERIGPRTRWVAVTGASNALGTMPDLGPIVAAAHAQGARVLVDAVHLVPHAPVDIGGIGCDILLTSPYKWYGPHAGVMWVHPELRDTIPVAKVRPAPDTAPARFETGTPSFEAIAGIGAAAEFLLDQGVAVLAATERERFRTLLAGLLDHGRVRVLGPRDLEARTPTVSFVVDGHSPEAVVTHLARHHIAAWSGNYYAVETMAALDRPDGAVRVGVSAYTSADEVDRLLAAIGRIAG